jgi:hypothetical protein
MIGISQVLDVALARGSKIEAIKLARNEGVRDFEGYWNGTYVSVAALPASSGLKDAKDYVEAAMEQGYAAPNLAPARIKALEGMLLAAQQEASMAERRADRFEAVARQRGRELAELHEIADNREARLEEVLRENDQLVTRIRGLQVDLSAVRDQHEEDLVTIHGLERTIVDLAKRLAA